MVDDIFIKKIQDVFKLSEKYHSPRFSKFLDENEQAVLKKEGIFGGTLFGGYEDSERCMLGAFPDWMEASPEDFPIKVLEITKKYDKDLSHRHYLGTILSLGIERNKIGDILVGEDVSFVFVCEDIAEFIKDSITKIAGCGVSIRICEFSDIKVPDKQFEFIETVAASLRLDAIIASMLKVSRNDAKDIILSGKVMVNHIEKLQTDFVLSKSDLLSVRGFGRTEIFNIGSRTRSERVHITLKKYI